MTARADLWGWQSTEKRLLDGAVESRQLVWTEDAVVEMSESGARELAARYWRVVRRTTRGLVRVRERDGGVEIRLPGLPPLLRFAPPLVTVEPDSASCAFPIVGGLLCREPSGSISFTQRRLHDRIRLESAIAAFHPRLAARPGAPAWTGELYKRVQARLHVAISRSYFRELTGGRRR